ncbi:hypothetical protein LZQ00_03060 [Sphingobacterium sp. SRCM116780]|uniref:hypothetical protein n=1 Tax=Sphingobacterium sp. SRCM116780 TaxID=2907623 RepID=UPI001F4616DF|nr:hypothetical protein [Sphingobacterium sp. SRCM116780]UIR56804.1 hypothetical protein LZQ00_03060 [Sphingobacterium sp. SRCM116780]
MNKLTKRLLNGFLFSGIGLFVLVAFTFILTQIWPTVWDEWREYKSGANLQPKIKNIQLYKNDFYNPAVKDSLEKLSLKEWYSAREKNDMLSPNGAADLDLSQAQNNYQLQIYNLADSVVYAKINNSFNPFITQAPASLSDMSYGPNMFFPKDIIDDSLQLQLLYKDKVIALFKPFLLRQSLDLGAGFTNRKNKEIKLKSLDGKIMLYLEFELNQ